MMKTNKIKDISNYLDKLLPNASCELNYNKDYELVIAVMLSAQTTDKAVNKVTDNLFKKYSTLNDFYIASESSIEEDISCLGLAKNKAHYLKEIANILITKFNGKVPNNKEELIKMPGIGNKTAGVILIELFKIPQIPVDTHIKRISNLLSLSNQFDPTKIQNDLQNLFPKERWIKLHHQLIHFGRYYCKSKSPLCNKCGLIKYCKNYQK